MLPQSIALKHGESEVYVGFSPFFLTFSVEVLSGGVGAASFPSVEKIIAKLSQQRWKKRRRGGQKQGKSSGGLTHKWFLTFFLQIRRRGAFRWFRCGIFSICRENNRKAEPAAAARKGGRAKNRPKTGEKGLKSEFSPFFCTFGVGVLCGGLSAASFPPVVQTIAKVSQQRRQKREGGQKQAENMWKRACTNHKVVEHRGRISKNGLVIISEMLSSTCKTGRRRGSGRTVEVQELGSFGLPCLRRKL